MRRINNIDADTMLQQENLLNEWIALCNSLEWQGGAIQNDLGRQRRDGHLTKEQLVKSTDDFVTGACTKIQEILLKVTEIQQFMTKAQDDF